MLELGVPEGKRVGEILQSLLDRIIAGELENDRDVLMREAVKML